MYDVVYTPLPLLASALYIPPPPPPPPPHTTPPHTTTQRTEYSAFAMPNHKFLGLCAQSHKNAHTVQDFCNVLSKDFKGSSEHQNYEKDRYQTIMDMYPYQMPSM